MNVNMSTMRSLGLKVMLILGLGLVAFMAFDKFDKPGLSPASGINIYTQDCPELTTGDKFSPQTRISNGFMTLKNYIPARRRFYGNESVTYTTHSDPTFLENLVTLAKRWDGPVSIAIYCPGSDYAMALKVGKNKISSLAITQTELQLMCN